MLDLTALGIGAIIGTGDFVIIGEAIGKSGPAIVRRSSNILFVTVLEQPAIAAVELADVLHALSDPARLEIVRALAADGERQCGTFDLGLTKATRSHHFKVLREAGVTDTRMEGTARFVTLRREELDAKFPGLLDAVTG